MALKMKRGQELQIVITMNAISGFDVVTRARVMVDGKAHERETGPRIRASDETELWLKVSELAQAKLVNLGLEAG